MVIVEYKYTISSCLNLEIISRDNLDNLYLMDILNKTIIENNFKMQQRYELGFKPNLWTGIIMNLKLTHNSFLSIWNHQSPTVKSQHHLSIN